MCLICGCPFLDSLPTVIRCFCPGADSIASLKVLKAELKGIVDMRKSLHKAGKDAVKVMKGAVATRRKELDRKAAVEDKKDEQQALTELQKADHD